MDCERKIYAIDDLKRIDSFKAPSLDIPSVEVDGVYKPKDGERYMIFLTHPKKEGIIMCPCCKSTDIKYSGFGKHRLVHDITRNNYRVDIILRPQLCCCNDCNHRFSMPIEGILENRQMTTRLLEYLKTECFLMPHTKLHEISGYSIETIQNIMDEAIEELEEQRRQEPPEAPTVLGIDEKHITYEMRGTLVDVENGVLLDMLENNKPQTMQNGIKSLANWDKNIKVVTTDMNNSYISWLPNLLPNATIVVDKFHVIQDIQKKINETVPRLYKYRKQLIENLSDVSEKARQSAILNMVNRNKFILKYSSERIVRDDSKMAEQLATVMAEFNEFAFLRNLYAIIEEMYLKETREEAEEVWEVWEMYLPPIGKKEYKDWCNTYNFTEDLFKPFQSFSRRSFKHYKPYILNYFNEGCRFTNATTEGLNNNIERINRVGCGYKFKHLRAKALYAPMVTQRIVYSVDLHTFRRPKETLSYSFMFNSPHRSSCTYEIVSKLEFNTHIERIQINPINIYKSNDYIDDLFVQDSEIKTPLISIEGFDNTELLDA